MPRYPPSHCPYCGAALEADERPGGTCPDCGEFTVQQPVMAVEVLVVDDDQVLLQQRATGRKQGRWGFPGGHVRPGEAPWAAAVRELGEETGLTAPVGALALTDVAFDGNPDGSYYVVIGFGLSRSQTTGSLDETSSETLALRFCAPSDLPADSQLFDPAYGDRMQRALRRVGSDPARQNRRVWDLR